MRFNAIGERQLLIFALALGMIALGFAGLLFLTP
jgi:hypothetical protein